MNRPGRLNNCTNTVHEIILIFKQRKSLIRQLPADTCSDRGIFSASAEERRVA